MLKDKLQELSPLQKTAIAVAALVVIVGCFFMLRPNEAEQKQRTAETEHRADSLALCITCTPTLESLPFYHALESGLCDTLGLKLIIHSEWAQFDVDSVYRHNPLCDGAVLDAYRVEHYLKTKCPLDAVKQYGLVGRWGLATSGQMRLNSVSVLKKHTVASARYATSYHCLEKSLGGTDVKMAQLYHAQINDYMIRLGMLENAQIEAALLPEPFFSFALHRGHRNVWVGDSVTSLGFYMKKSALKEEHTKHQLVQLAEAYNMAVDDLNAHGAKAAGVALTKYYALPQEVIDKVPLPRYSHVGVSK